MRKRRPGCFSVAFVCLGLRISIYHQKNSQLDATTSKAKRRPGLFTGPVLPVHRQLSVSGYEFLLSAMAAKLFCLVIQATSPIGNRSQFTNAWPITLSSTPLHRMNPTKDANFAKKNRNFQCSYSFEVTHFKSTVEILEGIYCIDSCLPPSVI